MKNRYNRTYPAQSFNIASNNTEGDHAGLQKTVAKAEVALHKYSCKGFCGFKCKEPKEYAIICVTPKANMADALQVRSRL